MKRKRREKLEWKKRIINFVTKYKTEIRWEKKIERKEGGRGFKKLMKERQNECKTVCVFN